MAFGQYQITTSPSSHAVVDGSGTVVAVGRLLDGPTHTFSGGTSHWPRQREGHAPQRAVTQPRRSAGCSRPSPRETQGDSTRKKPSGQSAARVIPIRGRDHAKADGAALSSLTTVSRDKVLAFPPISSSLYPERLTELPRTRAELSDRPEGPGESASCPIPSSGSTARKEDSRSLTFDIIDGGWRT